MNRDLKAFTLINILRNIVTIYFDTFFAIYFFNLTNYEILPFAKYYLFVYLSLVIAFWIIKNSLKGSLKVPYFRIGLSFTALYLALIMLLKEKIVNYVYLVAIIKGLGEGFYYYPRNILNTEKITNTNRRKYDGILSCINQVSSILIPLILGILLSMTDYITIGKYVFVLMVIIFILSFFVCEENKEKKPSNVLKIFKRMWHNRKLRDVLIIQYLKGWTISGGVLASVMTIYKILYFKSNFMIGLLNSALGILTCITCLLYATKLKKSQYKNLSILTLVLVTIMLVILSIKPTNWAFIVYLIVYATGITFISLCSDSFIANKSNDLFVALSKEEYHLILETSLGISRVTGHALLLVIGLLNNVLYLNYIMFLSIIPFTILIIYLIRNFDDII